MYDKNLFMAEYNTIRHGYMLTGYTFKPTLLEVLNWLEIHDECYNKIARYRIWHNNNNDFHISWELVP